LTGDETTWAFGGYGEAGSNVVSRVVGKPGVSKGGQTVLVSSTNRVRPYWYQHRHKYTKRYGDGWKAEGPCEVRTCIDDIEKLVEGREGEERKIFPSPPHLCWDNYFSGEQTCHHVGRKGFGLTTTCRRDRLPKGVKNEFLHKKKTDHVTTRTKIAKFIEPVILVKQDENYEIVLISFQSTSSCNIMTVNAISENRNFVEARSRGRNKHRRIYVIENNVARLIYLKCYSRIDSIDHLIKICKLGYRTWKYWHSAANHAKALAIVVAYDLYKELAEGHSDPDMKLESPVDFFTFCDSLSIQMCKYDPAEQKYPGDEKMRSVTQLHKGHKNELVYHKRIEEDGDGTNTITYQQYKKILKESKRVCKDLGEFEQHANHIYNYGSKARCVMCGEFCYKRCGICGLPMHHADTKGSN